MALFCPITNQIEGYPFEVVLPPGCKVTGAVLSDHVKNLNWTTRKAKRIAVAPAAVVEPHRALGRPQEEEELEVVGAEGHGRTRGATRWPRPRATRAAISPAISASGSSQSASPASTTAPGMPHTTLLARSWAMTAPPRSHT